jgi:hypothetical protein
MSEEYIEIRHRLSEKVVDDRNLERLERNEVPM